MKASAARHTKLVSAVLVALIWSGTGPPARGEDGLPLPRYDRSVLSEIADDVLRRGAAGATVTVPEEVWPGADAAKAEIAGAESAPDPVPPASDPAVFDRVPVEMLTTAGPTASTTVMTARE